MNCKNCQHWCQWETQQNGPVIVGDCRINPPLNYQIQPTAGSVGRFMTKWPSTKENDFCGAFKGNEKA